MSIINDALKKVQLNLKAHAQPAQEPQAQGPQAPTSQEPPSPPVNPFDSPAPVSPVTEILPLKIVKQAPLPVNWLTVLVSLAVMAGSMYYTWNQIKDLPAVKEWQAIRTFKSARAPHKNSNTPAKPLAKITVAGQPSPEGAKPQANQPAPAGVTLNINGIMAQGDANLALINNQIYQEGDTVSGAKIIKISLDSIVVLNNGREETIQVKK